MNEQKNRILVVDDDLGILRVFKRILEKEGYVVETAETGKDALEKIRNEKFSVCLIDVRLPDMDGTEVLAKMANDSETIKIIVTGFSSEEVGKKAADYGAGAAFVRSHSRKRSGPTHAACVRPRATISCLRSKSFQTSCPSKPAEPVTSTFIPSSFSTRTGARGTNRRCPAVLLQIE